MKTFVIAYLNLFDGNMEMFTIDAEDKLSAYKEGMLDEFGQEFVDSVDTAEAFEDRVFNCDGHISALEIFC